MSRHEKPDNHSETFRVFQILSKVFMILSFVAAGLALLGVTYALVWRNGGMVVGSDYETMLSLTNTAGLDQMIAELLADTVFALTDGILLLFAFLYFRAEQTDGTSFTRNGAHRVNNLGIKAIVLPIVAAIISAIIYGCVGLTRSNDWNNAGFILLGIILIPASPVFRYGAKLEANIKEAAE
ncbi:MAG: hypothetical protein ACI3XJ_00475 [Oscillospiraceae bacterium]